MSNQTRNGNMLLNGMLVVSFLILWRNLEHPNILVPVLSFAGFLMFVLLKIFFVLRQRKNNSPK
ncbi:MULTISPECIES: hypothetical protein [Rufibacter]|uniref:Uncharacterized protein n=1 Tax=Rufibacter quisquiliarum TaxID=1549639 RepID=A0A839GWZ4_9BACT|nr:MULTISPECIES: hypothetical protein [Rufibacter]MBA9079266.1 hypothetical protein [Rufibacter quisquiliarum]